ncbi:MAG: hypothetical protein JW904_11100 [Spirochaetales bacterium]|nr:hypothetical protein [Spirochaetales bacterium]
MKLTKKNIPLFIGTLFLGMVIGGLAWEIFERLLGMIGSTFSLTLKEPLGFDFYVFALFIRPNIGMAMGCAAGGLLFFKL